MSKELKMLEPKQYDDEIDLYELIEILVRHKWSIIITTIVCTLLSLGGALYVRSKTPNYLIKNILIQQDTYGLKGVNRIDPDSVLLQDGNVKKIIEIEPLKAKFLDETPKEFQNIAGERKFLGEIITLSKDDKNPGAVTIKTEIVGDEKDSREIINRYLEILKSEDNSAEVIQKEKDLKNKSLETTKNNLKDLEEDLITIFKNDSDIRSLKPEEKVGFLTAKYPALMLKKSEVERYYNTYVNELIRLDSLNDRVEVVKETSDIYFLKGESKAKLILAVGVVMGLFLGMMVAFLKEFIDGYKRRYKK
ncbi:Wzz/FepE/Etk N-terminal domain-containing protein [Cetobacterium somerae]|uniref:Wzz/FepE/Etk N-terminal domain-containing protein n=1 Tax=Cetobacterium somerae TaxID=188913 RepID=UPI003D767FCE